MKKHIFGLAVFGLIVALTAIGFAYFYRRPLPQIGEIKTPLTLNAKPTSCFPRLKTKISAEIESVALFADERKIVSKVKLGWNSESAPPARIYIETETFTLENISTSEFRERQILEAPFAGGKKAEITVETEISDWVNFDSKQNYYAVYDFSETDGADENSMPTEKKKAIARPIVLVHGKKSIRVK